MHPSSRTTEALLTLLSKYPSLPLPLLPSAALQSEDLLATYLQSLSTKGPDLTSLLTLARARRDLPAAFLALAALLDSGPTITSPQMGAWESFSQDVRGEVSTARSQVDWCEEVGAGWLTGVDPSTSTNTNTSSAASTKASPSSSCQSGSLVVKMDCSRTLVTGEGRQVRSYQRGNVVYEGFDGFSQGYAHWTWEIVDETDSQGTCLGVTTLPHDKEDYSDSKTHAVVRAYNGHTYIFGSGERDSPPSVSHPQGFKFFKGDMVRFDLDMDALTLAMSVNGQTRGMVCEGSVLEGKTLYPCISFYSEDRCCRLVEIEHVVKGGEGGEGGLGGGGSPLPPPTRHPLSGGRRVSLRAHSPALPCPFSPWWCTCHCHFYWRRWRRQHPRQRCGHSFFPAPVGEETLPPTPTPLPAHP